MLTTVLQRMDLTARSLIPLAITVLLVTLSVLPLRLTFLDPVAPDWALMSVQYWSVRRPDRAPHRTAARGFVDDRHPGRLAVFYPA